MPRTGGRVRNEDARQAILQATVDLLEDVGYGALTIEAVAARARVGKSTIYRWWRSKGDLVMDAYTSVTARRMPEPDTGSLATDLTDYVAQLYRVVRHPGRIQALRGLMAEAQLDPGFAEPFRQWVQSRRAVVAEILTRGIGRGELPRSVDLDHAVDLVFGTFWYRLLVDHAPLDPKLAPRHVDDVLHGLQGGGDAATVADVRRRREPGPKRPASST